MPKAAVPPPRQKNPLHKLVRISTHPNLSFFINLHAEGGYTAQVKKSTS
jgi:hypothetical protein